MLPVAFKKAKKVRLITLVWFLNQANRDPFKTEPLLLWRGALVSNESQPQAEDGHGRKKFNTHSGAPINFKARGKEVCFQLDKARTP